ncbi:ABC transporter G family member 23 [Galendromus occidentalis]|uniref:ABC transporter G family member 23 n=1 Tax=Galendromus occidentalis TaxID=34638 RepID=A0AAJ6QPH2_9ACAR|nr:ABC transporter G family member 23 [Galendromus occidentalis]
MQEVPSRMAVVCKEVLLERNGCSILKGVNMCVAQGQIYGLLGPSGCGKTTLLKCLLGDLVADSGSVSIMGLNPGREANRKVGYMPQEDALCDLFSVRETLSYFGKIYGMPESCMHDRMRFVCKLLGLNVHDRVRHMSGGQRRRLSLAVCILHSPPILILDEPTVGVDPLLSHDIWRYLRTLTDESGATVIITTHYIEEASGADMVALMRNGDILIEKNPKKLIEDYAVATLEDVLLEVCRNPEGVAKHAALRNSDSISPPSKPCPQSLVAESCVLIASMRRVRTLLFKERCSFARHPGTILYKCVFPLITLSLFFYTMECDLPDLPVAVVDEDQTSGSWLLSGLLDTQDNINVVYTNRSEAEQRLRDIRVYAVLTLNKNFSKSWNSTVEIDRINPYFRTAVERAVRETYMNPLVSTINFAPLLRPRYIFGDIGDNMYKSVYHRVVAQLSFGPSMLASVTHVFVSAHDDFIHRSKTAGCHTSELVLSFFISQGALVLIQTFLLVIYLFFKVAVSISFFSWLLVYSLLVGVGFSGISLSLLVCSECSEFTLALYMALLLNMVTFVMCGEIWPREGMPEFMRDFVAPLWPISYPADAMGVILYRDRWFEDRLVQLGVGTMVAWILIPILILVLISSFRKNGVF